MTDPCTCTPCPGRGNDGHGMSHCAECCFGTGLEHDFGCPVHEPAASTGASAMTTCPTCRGEGYRYVENAGRHVEHPVAEIPCTACQATGLIGEAA